MGKFGRAGPVGLALAVACLPGLTACEPAAQGADAPSMADIRAAERARREFCPDYEDESVAVRERAYAGDIDAMECLILAFRETVLFLEHEDALGEFEEYGEDGDNLDDIPRGWMIAQLYVRWRLSGEGQAELEEEARRMTKDGVERALTLSGFDASLLPRTKTDACGRVAEDDPRYPIIMLGAGERDPAECLREPY